MRVRNNKVFARIQRIQVAVRAVTLAECEFTRMGFNHVAPVDVAVVSRRSTWSGVSHTFARTWEFAAELT